MASPRVQLLLEDYAHFRSNPEGFNALIGGLVALRGRERVERWQGMARSGQWAELFGELMRDHYDPGYERSLTNHFPQLSSAPRISLEDSGPGSTGQAVQALLAIAGA